ncbi:MAG: aminoacyl-tRNA hydrolase [Anaerolineaceae bacterium]|nr:aminoacyl-tRNA hydrolase [Anaerolineaceae bacterium]
MANNLLIPSIYLFIGLGNPGRDYRYTRHNIGFICIDKLSEILNIKINRVKNKTLYGDGLSNTNKVIIAKPQTYMNLSGKAVTSLVQYYKVPLNQVLIIHDDIDLPLGTIRIRPSGSSGGQKGINSVIQMLGTDQFPRMRIGIDRPPGKMNPETYVLQRFTEKEAEILDEIIDRSCKACLAFMDQGIDQTMNQFNQSLPEIK